MTAKVLAISWNAVPSQNVLVLLKAPSFDKSLDFLPVPINFCIIKSAVDALSTVCFCMKKIIIGICLLIYAQARIIYNVFTCIDI